MLPRSLFFSISAFHAPLFLSWNLRLLSPDILSPAIIFTFLPICPFIHKPDPKQHLDLGNNRFTIFSCTYIKDQTNEYFSDFSWTNYIQTMELILVLLCL
jgi:hypothetical protein